MPVIINGTTGLSGVSTVNLANGSVTQNILANGVAGTGPSFSAYQSSEQSVTLNTWTKVACQTKQWDTANCYNASTYRFTPNVGGYYQVGGSIFVKTTPTGVYAAIYKNGISEKIVNNVPSTAGCGGSALIYLNGTTDYVELYTYIGATQNLSALVDVTYFQASLARAA